MDERRSFPPQFVRSFARPPLVGKSSRIEIQLHFQHIDVELVRLDVPIVFTQAGDLYKTHKLHSNE